MSINTLKKQFRNYGEPWTKDLDDILTTMFVDGCAIKALAKFFGRTEGSISSRLCHLKLMDYTTGKITTNRITEREQTLKTKADSIRAQIERVRGEIESKMETLNQKRSELFKISTSLDNVGIPKDRLEKMLSVSIRDMLDNKWYSSEEEAFESLLERASENV